LKTKWHEEIIRHRADSTRDHLQGSAPAVGLGPTDNRRRDGSSTLDASAPNTLHKSATARPHSAEATVSSNAALAIPMATKRSFGSGGERRTAGQSL
jgi:hypothetical protein